MSRLLITETPAAQIQAPLAAGQLSLFWEGQQAYGKDHLGVVHALGGGGGPYTCAGLGGAEVCDLITAMLGPLLDNRIYPAFSKVYLPQYSAYYYTPFIGIPTVVDVPVDTIWYFPVRFCSTIFQTGPSTLFYLGLAKVLANAVNVKFALYNANEIGGEFYPTSKLYESPVFNSVATELLITPLIPGGVPLVQGKLYYIAIKCSGSTRFLAGNIGSLSTQHTTAVSIDPLGGTYCIEETAQPFVNPFPITAQFPAIYSSTRIDYNLSTFWGLS